ncbi:MAG: hypothetical protein MJK18_01090, partial [Bdellovibrionales bacterium]|nr:hypothetical protein [Bdellovibrionales bacterium]
EFSRTNEGNAVNFGPAGRFMDNQIDNNNITLGNDKDLGNELDIWLDYNAGSGMQVRSTIAIFQPGAAFENATTTSGASPTTTVYQILTQVGFFF